MSIFLSILMWTGIVLGGIVALVILYFLVGFVIMTITGSSPKGIEFEVICPALIPTGDPFVMTIVVRNQLDGPRTFWSLDFEHGLLKGMVVERLEPQAKESSSSFGTTTHQYELHIPARDTVKFVLNCHALEPGDYSGDITVYVDNKHWKFVSKSQRLVVR